MKRVLFVCIENANRSQLAEAFARIHGAGRVEPFSAGSHPAPAVNPRAIRAMRERGYDLSTHRTRSLAEVPEGSYDYVITMGCGDACPWVPAAHREDWALDDPRDLGPAAYARVRDEIEERVLRLLTRIDGGGTGESKGIESAASDDAGNEN